MTDSETAAFLAEPQRLVRLATVDGEGRPQVIPAWYVPADESLLIAPRSQSAWLGHLWADPRVGAVVDEDQLPYRKVVVSTDVEILKLPGEDDTWRDIFRAISLRYWDVEAVDAFLESTIHVRRALISIPLHLGTPEVLTWRLPVAGEDPTGIWASRYGPVSPTPYLASWEA